LLANHLHQIALVSSHNIETFQFLDSCATPIIGDSASNEQRLAEVCAVW